MVRRFLSPKMDCCFPDVTLETIETWWLHLKQSNKDYLKERAKLKMPFFAASEKMVNLIFNIGHNMELPREILLTSVILLDRFMSTSYGVVNKETSRSQKLKLMQKLKDNMVLHICSCLQLASKAIGQRDVLVSDIQKFMSSQQKNVTKCEIIKSEEFIFKALNYRIPAYSPLIHVEILAHLIPAKRLSLECTSFCETSSQFMMVAYCHHQALYDSLFYILTSKENCHYRDRLDFLSVELDGVYLAGAAAFAAVQTLGKSQGCSSPPERRPAKTHLGALTSTATATVEAASGQLWIERRLQQLTGVSERELRRLATILMDIALDPADVDS